VAGQAEKGRKAEESRDAASYLNDLQDDLEVLEIGDSFDGMRPKSLASPMGERTNGTSTLYVLDSVKWTG